MRTLDITSFKETGQDLVNKIAEEVKATQSVIIQDYPDEMLVTEKQFKELLPLEDLMEMSEYIEIVDLVKVGKEKLWRTPYNVMEIRVEEVKK